MNKTRILEIIKDLAKSQGLYGRLLEYIEENPEFLNELEQQNFKDPVDLILYIEC